MNKWISVDERLPEKCLWCLVQWDGAIMTAAWNEQREVWEDWNNSLNPNVPLHLITHWMPLPDPPEVDND